MSASPKNSDSISADRELVLTRVFDAPRALVFKVWTDPMHSVRWMGPRDYPAFSVKSDLRPGGKWRIGLRSTDGTKELWQSGEYREVREPELIAFTFAWDAIPGTARRGDVTFITVTFEEAGGKTTMTFRQSPFDTKANRDGHASGWTSTFDRFQEHLKESAA